MAVSVSSVPPWFKLTALAIVKAGLHTRSTTNEEDRT